MVRQLLGTISDENLSLSGIIQGNPQIMALLDVAFNNSEDALGVLLNAPLRNPLKLTEMFTAADPFQYLCNQSSSEIQEMFSIPSHIDAEKVHSAVCRANQSILNELYSLSGWEHLDAELQNPSSATWQEIFQNIEGLSGDITHLLENLPRSFEDPNVNLTAMEDIISRFYQDLDITSEQDVFELIGVFNSVVTSIFGNVAENVTEMYFKMFLTYVNYANSIFDKIQIHNQEVQLGSLFENTTAWKNVLQFVFGLQENNIEALLGSTIRVDQVCCGHIFFIDDSKRSFPL